jgi:hypothetical protein
MSKHDDKLEIVDKIKKAVQLYKTHLVGKSFIYVFDNRYIEVLFRTKDFSHMTGVYTNLSAKDFYTEALRKTLTTNQIDFTKRYPYRLSSLKVNQLLSLNRMISSDLIILETLVTQSTTYKFGVTELELTLCLDKDLDSNGVPKSDFYIVKSLRVEDSFPKSQNAYEVEFIFSKQNDTKLYNCIEYQDKRKDVKNLPQNIRILLEKAILNS